MKLQTQKTRRSATKSFKELVNAASEGKYSVADSDNDDIELEIRPLEENLYSDFIDLEEPTKADKEAIQTKLIFLTTLTTRMTSKW